MITKWLDELHEATNVPSRVYVAFTGDLGDNFGSTLVKIQHYIHAVEHRR